MVPRRWECGRFQARVPWQHDLEHEARADIGQQQQHGSDIQPTRRPSAAPAAQASTGEQRREHRPAEQRQQVLWSQRQCDAVATPSASAADSTAKPTSTKRKVKRSSCSSGMPACLGGIRPLAPQPRSARIQQRSVQDGRAEQARTHRPPARSAAAPKAKWRSRHVTRKPGGQQHHQRTHRRQPAAHRRQRHEPAFDGMHADHDPYRQRQHRSKPQPGPLLLTAPAPMSSSSATGGPPTPTAGPPGPIARRAPPRSAGHRVEQRASSRPPQRPRAACWPDDKIMDHSVLSRRPRGAASRWPRPFPTACHGWSRRCAARPASPRATSRTCCAKCAWPCSRPTSRCRWCATSSPASRTRRWARRCAGSLNPGQALVGIVHKELAATMGEGVADINLATQPPAVILMAGLQGSGKTTSTAKIAKHLITSARRRCSRCRPTSTGRPPSSSSRP
jgi:hypothetical protein